MSAKTANVVVGGIDLVVEFDHQPLEPETLTYPGCPESVEITNVSVNGIDFAVEWLSNYFIELMEEQVLEECV